MGPGCQRHGYSQRRLGCRYLGDVRNDGGVPYNIPLLVFVDDSCRISMTDCQERDALHFLMSNLTIVHFLGSPQPERGSMATAAALCLISGLTVPSWRVFGVASTSISWGNGATAQITESD